MKKLGKKWGEISHEKISHFSYVAKNVSWFYNPLKEQKLKPYRANKLIKGSLMNHISTVCQTLHHNMEAYGRHIPKNTGKAILYSAVGAFVLRTICTGNPLLGVIASVFSVTATALHALVTPFFKMMIGNREELTWGEEMCRGGLAIIATATLAAVGGDMSIMEKLAIPAVNYVASLAFNVNSFSIKEANFFYIRPFHFV